MNKTDNMGKKVFISADHGLAIVYFLQSDVVSTLIDVGVEVVLLTDDVLKEKIEARFGREGLTVEGLRFKGARIYERTYRPSVQFWVGFLRRSGASKRINLGAVEPYLQQVAFEAGPRRRLLFPMAKMAVGLLQRSKIARRALVRYQRRFTPNIYSDLFDKYQPDMVIASTPGWRLDRYLLREAAARGIPTTTVIVGWDNSSSYNLSGADMDWATCWSQLQKDEMVHGSDWPEDKVFIGGIPSYDGYFRKEWQMSREAYFKLHNLDPERKLISYASSFITFSPNIQNIKALARVVTGGELAYPSQLLIRLHPNHFMDVPHFAAEREAVRKLAAEHPHIHVIEPVALGGELGHYSGEDMPEKASMMAHSDVMVTVYSTMAVEATVNGCPVISLCIDSPTGWPKEKFTLPLTHIADWPTHERFRKSGAGKVTLNEKELEEAINYYLQNPDADQDIRQAFITNECTYTDGTAGKRTGQILLDLLEKEAGG
jgi:CDP-glycerol glycerophosphotransferase (TagB/SpsB family)